MQKHFLFLISLNKIVKSCIKINKLPSSVKIVKRRDLNNLFYINLYITQLKGWVKKKKIVYISCIIKQTFLYMYKQLKVVSVSTKQNTLNLSNIIDKPNNL